MASSSIKALFGTQDGENIGIGILQELSWHVYPTLRNKKHRKQDEMTFGSTMGKIED
jgi:hypothetical protein